MVSIMWVDKIIKRDMIKGINKGAESLGVIFQDKLTNENFTSLSMPFCNR